MNVIKGISSKLAVNYEDWNGVISLVSGMPTVYWKAIPLTLTIKEDTINDENLTVIVNAIKEAASYVNIDFNKVSAWTILLTGELALKVKRQ